jgi:Flp pilus assembly protein TadD
VRDTENLVLGRGHWVALCCKSAKTLGGLCDMDAPSFGVPRCARRLLEILAAGIVVLFVPMALSAAAVACNPLLARAQQLLSAGEWQDARVIILTVTKQCADSAQAYNLLGISYDQEGRFEEAEEAYGKAIELAPGWAGFRNNLAASYLHSGNRAKAVHEFQEALRLDPHNRFAEVNLGNYYFERKNYRLALEYLRKAGVDRSGDPVLLLEIARAYFATGEEQRALRSVAIISHIAGAGPKVHFSSGLLLAEHGRYADAVTQFEAIPGGERDFAVYQNLGLAYSKLGRVGQARAAYEDALRLSPSSPEPYMGLGLSFSGAGELDQAVYWLSEAHRRAPERVDVTCALAEALVHARHFERAQDLLLTAMKQHPHNAAMLKTSGDFYAARHFDRQARRAYQDSLQQDPREVGARLALAQLDQRLNQASQAKDEYEQVLRIEPDNPDAHAALGSMALEAGHLHLAMQHVKRALQRNPSNLHANEDLAAIELRKGALSAAMESLQKLVHIDPSNPRFHYQLGQVLLKLGRKSEAQAEFLKSQQLQSAPGAHMGR